MSIRELRRAPLPILVLLGLFIAGCQSCQGTKDVPPPSSKPAKPAAEPIVAEPVDVEDDEEDEDALVLLAEGEPEDGVAPLSVRFVVESLIADEMNAPKYTWEFGDGTPDSNEAGPVHVYEKPGSYTASIRFVDAVGQRGWDEVDIEVDEP